MTKTKKLLILAVIVSVVLSIAAVASNEIAAPLRAISEYDWAKTERDVVPDYTAGNNTSFPYTYDFNLTENNPGNGTRTYNLGDGRSLTVVVGSGALGQCITSWSAVGIKIEYFVVKAGDGYFTYLYKPTGFFWDNTLYPPLNNGGQHPTISHYTIYYSKPDIDETTTTSATDPTTTVTDPTTTVTDPTTTVTDPTTTVTDPTTTVTDPTTTQPSVETITETTIVITITDTQPPLVSETTTNPTITEPDIPQTGEAGSGNGLMIGLILMIMAAGLTIVVYRSQAVKA